tara:strand:- start:2117 stop:2791 length:675 start_codon:yes stop_codon:yes gene_type:complete
MKKKNSLFIILICIIGCFLIVQLLNNNFSNKKHIPKINKKGNLIQVNRYILARLEKDKYSKHRHKAQKTTNHQYVKDIKTRKRYVNSNKLLKVNHKGRKGYYIQKLDYSSKHLTPLAYKRLNDLGSLFMSNLNKSKDTKSYFIVSSLTRTEKQQKDLRESGEKGATKGKSSHNYGVSFDISHIKSFSSDKITSKALENALKRMQKEKKILLLSENDCIHVTAIN